MIVGSIEPGCVPTLCERLRSLLNEGSADLVVCDVKGLDRPSAVTVDALARLQLTARSLGSRLRLRNACRELEDLLALTGLREVLPAGPD